MIPVGKGRVVQEGSKIAILAFGSMLQAALEAAEEINATVCDMRFVKPLDRDLLLQIGKTHEFIVTIEENVIAGGAGSACAEALQDLNIQLPILHLGIPDQFIEHGDPKLLLSSIGLDSTGILKSIRQKNWL